MKKTVGISVLLLCLVVAVSATAVASDHQQRNFAAITVENNTSAPADWPEYRTDDGYGNNPDTVVPRYEIEEAWSISGSESPIMYNGTLYSVTGDGYDGSLRAIDPETGDVVWTTDLGAGTHTPAAIDGHIIVADDGSGTGNDNARVAAYDPATGAQVWETGALGRYFNYGPDIQFGDICVRGYDSDAYENSFTELIAPGDGDDVGGCGSSTYDYHESVSEANGIRYEVREQNTNDDILIATKGGTELWRYDPATVISSPTTAEDVVFVGVGGSVVALNGTDGTTLWSHPIDGRVNGEIVVTGGAVYVSSSFDPGSLIKLTGLSETELRTEVNATEVNTGQPVQFTVSRSDTGKLANATVEVDNTTLNTGSDGVVNYTFTSMGNYTAVASKQNTSKTVFRNDTNTVTVRQSGKLNISTNAPANIGSDSATLEANLTGLGGSSSAEVWFKYREVGTSGFTRTGKQTISSLGEFSVETSGLEPGTEYEVYAVASTDSDWTQDRPSVTFTTEDTLSVNTLSTTNVTSESATLTGESTGLGNASSAEVWFKYREVGTSRFSRTSRKTISSLGEFSIETSGLAPGTDYEVYAVASTESDWTQDRPPVTFTTDEILSVSTTSTTSVDGESATLRGNLTSLGGASSGEVWFKYSPEGSSGLTRTAQSTKTSTGSYEIDVSGLESGTTYEVWAVASTESDWTQDRPPVTFTTE